MDTGSIYEVEKSINKAGYKIAFKSGANLQTILTGKNKTILPKNSQPGTYKIQCKCHRVPPYIGETKIQIRNRNKQHEDYVIKEIGTIQEQPGMKERVNLDSNPSRRSRLIATGLPERYVKLWRYRSTKVVPKMVG